MKHGTVTKKKKKKRIKSCTLTFHFFFFYTVSAPFLVRLLEKWRMTMPDPTWCFQPVSHFLTSDEFGTICLRESYECIFVMPSTGSERDCAWHRDLKSTKDNLCVVLHYLKPGTIHITVNPLSVEYFFCTTVPSVSHNLLSSASV